MRKRRKGNAKTVERQCVYIVKATKGRRKGRNKHPVKEGQRPSDTEHSKKKKRDKEKFREIVFNNKVSVVSYD